MSASDNDNQADRTDRLLTDFFRGELPRAWPKPPWRGQATAPLAPHGMRGKWALVAALVLATVGLSLVGEVPSSWPGSRDPLTKGKLEASRPSRSTKPAPLPGFRVPDAAKASEAAKP